MTYDEFADGMTKLSSGGFKSTPQRIKLEGIIDNWYDQFKGVSTRIFAIATQSYQRSNEYFPTMKALLEEISIARKTNSEADTGKLLFGNKQICEEIIWGIQLMDDIYNQVDLIEEVRERKGVQFKAGLKLLEQATPGMTHDQRNRLRDRIAKTDSEPIAGSVTYQAWLYDNAMEIISER